MYFCLILFFSLSTDIAFDTLYISKHFLFRSLHFCIIKKRWMFLWSLMFMMYLQGFLVMVLCKPFILKIPGMSGTYSILWRVISCILVSILPFTNITLWQKTVTSMRELILSRAWEVMGSYCTHQTYLGLLYHLLCHSILDLLDFWLHILYVSDSIPRKILKFILITCILDQF